MVVLGISGRDADAAAAIAIDGRAAAAVTEDVLARVPHVGYAATGGLPARAIAACCRRAGVDPDAIDRLVVVDGEAAPESASGSTPSAAGPGRATSTVNAALADAWLAAASGGADAVLIGGRTPPQLAGFARDGDRLVSIGADAGSGACLDAAVRAAAGRLGLATGDPVAALDRLSIGGEPRFADRLTDAMAWRQSDGIRVDLARLDRAFDAAAGALARDLACPGSMNVHLHQTRRDLAASVVVRLAGLLEPAVAELASRKGVGRVALGGSLFSAVRLRGELRRTLGEVAVPSAVPEPCGRALGAAISVSGPAGTTVTDLGLGPAFSEGDVKGTLDNCRLDYLYEPDWNRLVRRVSGLLAQGKTVAWFQGALGFGPRALGSRSILCDPSTRYARQNVNEYLLGAPLDEPLPVVFASSRLSACLTTTDPPPACGADVDVRPEWHRSLAGALDWRRRVRAHGLATGQAPALDDLLELHADRTGVPALIEVPLCAAGEPVACSPRDAVRTVYSSAVDALVMGRFVLMKDHWLLRADVG